MGIRIVTDSASDLSIDIERQYHIKILPLTVNFSDTESYQDRFEISPEGFYKKLGEGDVTPYTSQVNPNAFEEAFIEILSKGDDVLGIFLSQDLSGTYNSAVIAKESLPQYKDRINLIDSRSVSLGLSLLVYKAALYVSAGNSMHSTIAYIEGIKEKVESIIIVDTLEYLKKGGRLTAGAAFIGGVLNLKPILEIRGGKLVAKDKVRGRKKVLKYIASWVEEHDFDFSNKTIYMVNANEKEYMNEVKTLLVEKYGANDILESQVGAVVGSHSGPGAVGFCFVNE
ncbi:MAG: DegV family protein [Eubacteriaceae bacterium]|nr:DegV family protein [Eubacteriaceae bacterium]